MKIYFAGNSVMIEREKQNKKIYRCRLFSYFHILPGQIEHDVFKWIAKTEGVIDND